jgi:hypothetical protein
MRNSLRGPLRRSRRRIEGVREGIESCVRQQHKMRIVHRLTMTADGRRHGPVDTSANKPLRGALPMGAIFDRALVHGTHRQRV